MRLTKDMLDFISLMDKREVEYMLVGGVAVICHGYMRSTQDIDFLVYPSEENAEKIMSALRDFGFGEAGIPKSIFLAESGAVHLGVEPNRIDLLTSLTGVSNKELFADVVPIEVDGITVKTISLRNLLKVKRYAGRLKDLADVEELEKIKEVF